MSAFRMPSARVLDCFVKKLTVMGIMGKTHGVSNAAKPKPNPRRNVQSRPSSPILGFVAFALVLSVAGVATLTCAMVAEVLRRRAVNGAIRVGADV